MATTTAHVDLDALRALLDAQGIKASAIDEILTTPAPRRSGYTRMVERVTEHINRPEFLDELTEALKRLKKAASFFSEPHETEVQLRIGTTSYVSFDMNEIAAQAPYSYNANPVYRNVHRHFEPQLKTDPGYLLHVLQQAAIQNADTSWINEALPLELFEENQSQVEPGTWQTAVVGTVHFQGTLQEEAAHAMRTGLNKVLATYELPDKLNLIEKGRRRSQLRIRRSPSLRQLDDIGALALDDGARKSLLDSIKALPELFETQPAVTILATALYLNVFGPNEEAPTDVRSLFVRNRDVHPGARVRRALCGYLSVVDISDHLWRGLSNMPAKEMTRLMTPLLHDHHRHTYYRPSSIYMQLIAGMVQAADPGTEYFGGAPGMFEHADQVAQRTISEEHLQLLCRVIPSASDEEVQADFLMLLDWLGANPELDRNQLLRANWDRIIELNVEWHAKMAEVNGGRVGNDAWDPFIKAFNTLGHDVVPIATAAAIRHEGKVMRHCVGNGGYMERCLKGGSLIFSIQKNDKHIATLQLDSRWGHQWYQVQLKGYRNSVFNHVSSVQQVATKTIHRVQEEQQKRLRNA